MKTRFFKTTIFLVVLFTVVLTSVPAFCQTTSFTYQGHLTDAGAAANGNYDFQFLLWDSLTNGVQVGSTQSLNAIAVNNGVFTVSLDFGANAFPGANRFLEIRARRAGTSGFTLLEPRQQVTSTPYSVRSVNASSADALSSACAGCVQNTQINSVAGTKVTGAVGSATNVTGVVGVANGGTGSTVKNFVDLNTNQTIGGTKSFSGNLGIGTTTPNGQLHVDGGSNLTFTRTSGRSPVFAAGTGASNQELIMGYVTQAGDYVASSQVGDSFLFPSSNEHNTYLGRVTGNTALMTLDNTIGNVGIGTNDTEPQAKLDVRGNVKLGSSGQYFAPGGEENLRIIRGVVNGGSFECDYGNVPCPILAGSGFQAQWIDNGDYLITLNTPFNGFPAVVVTPDQYVSQRGATTYEVGTRTFKIHIEDDANRIFAFIAIGPR